MTRTSIPPLLFNLGLISFILANPTDIINPNISQLSNSKNQIDWMISIDICSVASCKCQEHERRIDISCHCTDENQIVNLKRSEFGDKLKFFQKETLWTIGNCGSVLVHPYAFYAVNGEYFDLRLMNLSSVEINEEAFELTSGKNEHTIRKISFHQVNITKLPQKAFPSKLNMIEFINCDIGTILKHAFVANNFSQIIFIGSTIGTIETEAFSESLLIESWLVRNTKFHSIRSRGIASSVTNMTWMDSELEHLESFAFSGVIANSSFKGNQIGEVESNGLTMKEWTWISYVNNTFGRVNYSGIDLSKHSSNFNVTEFSGNIWTEVQPDFIVASQTESIIAIIRNNRLNKSCVCDNGILSEFVTSAESNVWFLDEFTNNSQCYTNQKGAECIRQTSDQVDGAGKIFIPYTDQKLFCNETVDHCINSFKDQLIHSTPNVSPSRIRLLLILIGSIGVAIVICLVGVMFVYLCRRSQRSNKSSPSSSTQGELAKVLSKSSSMSYADIVNKSSSASTSNGIGNLSSRPRSTIFEDVEMEDKGVQTMPSELSTDVLEGLRAKLSHPDSFWDAKETIDHLYDLIHVRETSPLSSPPDVTMLCNSSTGTTPQSNTKPKTNNTSTSTSSKLTRARPVTPRYAQIRSKPKTAPICEYGDPSDTQMHIYSELGTNQSNSNNRQSTSTGTQAYLCEYTEPKDVQTHVYAELNSTYPKRTQYVQENRSSPQMASTPVQRFDYLNLSPSVSVPIIKNSTSFQTQILDSPCPSTPPCQQRPLPSIPSVSNVQ